MASANFNLKKFVSSVRTSSLARTNRFEVLIVPPAKLRSRNGASNDTVSLYCEQASLPILNIAAKPFKIFGPTYQRPFTSEYGGEGISFLFHVDRNMQVRKFFEDWMHLIVNPTTFTVAYQSDYITSILIRQLDEANNITHEIELLEAFPRNLGIMELNHSSSNQTHRLNVLFAYRYWRTKTGVNPIGLPSTYQYPQVPVRDNRAIYNSPSTTGQTDYSKTVFEGTYSESTDSIPTP